MTDAVIGRLINLTNETGYPIAQTNGQRKFGPPPHWKGPPPPKGCEVFIGKIPRDCYEDEIIPVFSKIGDIYELRLMMDFSGSNRGYGFVCYTNSSDAYRAIRDLNGYAIRPNKYIGVVKSVDNCRLFVGGIPKTKTKEEVKEELSKRVKGVVEVILYSSTTDRNLNRGFAFVEFEDHRAAAMARRQCVPGNIRVWDHNLLVDWAEPEPDVDEEIMKRVKVLYVRNLLLQTTPETVQCVFENAIKHGTERVKKIRDFAFVHFFTREHAEIAMATLNNTEIEGAMIEIKWAKPVNTELYKMQKLSKGNAKFNNPFELTQTIYKHEMGLSVSDSGTTIIGNACDNDHSSGYIEGSSSLSPSDSHRSQLGHNAPQVTNQQRPSMEYLMAPIKLDAICKRYSSSPPEYTSYPITDGSGRTLYLGAVVVRLAGHPPRHAGCTRPALTIEEAYASAAQEMLYNLKNIPDEDKIARLPYTTLPIASPLQRYYPSPYLVNVPAPQGLYSPITPVTSYWPPN